jgi:hypothetical protein
MGVARSARPIVVIPTAPASEGQAKSENKLVEV